MKYQEVISDFGLQTSDFEHMEIVVLLEYQSGHNMGSQSTAASVTFTLSLSPNIGYCFVSSWLNKDAIMREHRDVKI